MHVSIIGSGFAALAAIRKLRHLDLARKLTITLISPKAEFVCLPSLIWVPSGQRDGQAITASLKKFFKENEVIHHAGEARAIKDGGRTVITSAGEVKNDGLIIASGATYMKKAPGLEHTFNPCSGIPAVEAIKRRIQGLSGGTIAMGFAGNPKEPAGVRGGPMFEFLFGLDTQLKQEKRRQNFKLAFFTPMPEPGKRLGPKAVKGLLAAMKKRKIETFLDAKIAGFDAGGVNTNKGRIDSDLTLFLPGMVGSPWFKNTGLPLSAGGFIRGDAKCRVPEHHAVYVAGDAGSFPGPDWKAKQAHMAEIQAYTAATNLYSELKGQEPLKTFRTELVCIVDTLNSGILISRFPRFSLILPPNPLMHWVKQKIEQKIMAPLR
ncbi:NAD(P)/FAD-dependent oxidoreductase [Magnetococcales bacterium HHB-1]